MLRANPATSELTPAGAESPDAPDGVICKACGDRRASVCPPVRRAEPGRHCQLIAAGLRGGKGVPVDMAGHDLRHSYATWLVSDGVPPNVVQRIMGQEDVTTTLCIYTDVPADYVDHVDDVFDDSVMTDEDEDDAS